MLAKERGTVLLSLILVIMTGCAFHYSDRQRGFEHLVGLGSLRLSRQTIGTNLTSVATSSRVAGLKIGLGKDSYGLSLGYTKDQHKSVFESDAWDNRKPTGGEFIPLGSGWAFGHVKMAFPPERKPHALLYGSSVMGFRVEQSFGSGMVDLGVRTRNATLIPSDSTWIEFESPNSMPWPYLDALQLNVSAPLQNK
jgi:hypothetical protein